MQYAQLLSTPRRSIAAFLLLTLVSWSLGLPTFLPVARALSLNTVSDLLSDSGTSALSNHTISFTTPATAGYASGDTVVVTFPAGFDLSTIAIGDVDVTVGGADVVVVDGLAPAGNEWGFDANLQTITFELGPTATVAAATAIAIEIGTHATYSGVNGVNQIQNPAAGFYEITIAGTSVANLDADTRVVILDHVSVTAQVDTIFEFEVIPVADTETVNSVNITDTSVANALDFTTLVPGAGGRRVMAHELRVKTNATQGYSVTLEADGTLTAGTGDDIDVFDDGVPGVPAAWSTPAGTIGNADTYGHEGVTTEDTGTPEGFGASEWSGEFLGTPLEVLENSGPVTWSGVYGDGSYNAGVATTRVGYSIETTVLQEAANDYTQTFWYVATPTF
jgi:hypothetical protein